MVSNWDSRLIPIFITLLDIFGSLLEREIKIVSLYFPSSSNEDELMGPIIILAPLFIISFIAKFNFFFSLEPLSLGIIIIFLSSISLSASWVDNNKDSPKFLYSPEKGASNPILSFSSLSSATKFELNNMNM